MVYIETQDLVGPTEALARSTKIWFCLPGYIRIETLGHASDSEVMDIIIINMLNLWRLTPVDGTGVHYLLDSIPSHARVFGPPNPSLLLQMSFCQEIEFFEYNRAKQQYSACFDGRNCLVYQMQVDQISLTMFADSASHVPLKITYQSPEGVHSILYRAYQEGLQFDSTLFVTPAGYQLSEGSRLPER